MKDFKKLISNDVAPISAQVYKKLSINEKKELKTTLEEKGLSYDDYISDIEKLFPQGSKKNPIVWRKR